MESITKLTVLKLQAAKVQHDRAKQVLNLLEEGLKLSIANYLDLKATLDGIILDYDLKHSALRLYLWNKLTPRLQDLIAVNGFVFINSRVLPALLIDEKYTISIQFPHSIRPASYIELWFNYAEDAFENGSPYFHQIPSEEFKAEFGEAYGELI